MMQTCRSCRCAETCKRAGAPSNHMCRCQGQQHVRKLASSACLKTSGLCLSYMASWLGCLYISPLNARFARLLKQGGPWCSMLLGFLI